jgi:hypothetical protein
MIDIEKRDLINSRFASRPIEYEDLDEIIEYTGFDSDRLKPKQIIDVLGVHTKNKDRNILKSIVADYLFENYEIKIVQARLNGAVPTNVYKGIVFRK